MELNIWMPYAGGEGGKSRIVLSMPIACHPPELCHLGFHGFAISWCK